MAGITTSSFIVLGVIMLGRVPYLGYSGKKFCGEQQHGIR